MNQTSEFYSLHRAAGWVAASSGGFTDGNNPRGSVWNSSRDEVDAYDELFASTTNLMEKMDLNLRGPDASSMTSSSSSQPLGSAASMRSWPQQQQDCWPAATTTQRRSPGRAADQKGVRLQQRRGRRQQYQRPAAAAAAQRHGVRKSSSSAQSQRTSSYGHTQRALYLGRIEWLDPVRDLAANTAASGGCGLQVATCWEAGSIANMKQGAVVAAGDDMMAWEEEEEEAQGVHMDDFAAAAATVVLCSDTDPPVKPIRTWTELAWAPLRDGTLAWQDPWKWFFDELDPSSRGNLTEPPLEWLPMHGGTTFAWQDPLHWRQALVPDIIIAAQYDDDDEYC